MSAEEAVTDALQTPIDQNAQAAEETKRMLAELQGEAASTDEPKETNGATEVEKPAEEPATDKKAEENQRESETPREHRHGRSDRGGRGRGRGGQNYNAPRNYRDNIKSDLTTQEESSDPAAIRKQVRVLCR